MTPIEWLIMGLLVAIFGVIPPFIVGHFMLKKSQLLLDEAIKIRKELPTIIKRYLASEEFTKVVNNVVTGKMNYEVKNVKNQIAKQGDLSGLPQMVKTPMTKGISLWMKQNFDVPRSVTEGIFNAFLNKKSPEQKARDDELIKQYAVDQGYNPNMPPVVQPIQNTI